MAKPDLKSATLNALIMKASRTYKAGRSTYGWQKGEPITTLEQVKPGDIYIMDSHQFQATNLVKVQSLREIPRGFRYNYATPDAKTILYPDMSADDFELKYKDRVFFRAERTAMKKKDKSEMISASGLKGKRDWTDGLIERFLPEPDETAKNPHYRSAAPMKLYLLERVEQIEVSEEWLVAFAVAESRKKSAKKGTETKLRALVEHLDTIKFEVPRYEWEELASRACDHYNERQAGRRLERADIEDWRLASPDSDEGFLHRIAVNYLRHEATSYERQLRKVFGRVGVRTAYREISRKAYDAIGEAYPFLKDECVRQFQAKFAE